MDYKGKNVLDVGCRQGEWTKWFLDKGADVTAVDINRDDLEYARKKYPQVRFMCADAKDVMLKKKFDLIFCKDVIEHIREDRVLIGNLAKHLALGGYIVIGTQNYISLRHLIEGSYCFLTGRVWQGLDSSHVSFYSKWRLYNLFKRYGIKPVSCHSAWHLTPLEVLAKVWFGITREIEALHIVDRLKLNGVFPFDFSGFWICVVGKRNDEQRT